MNKEELEAKLAQLMDIVPECEGLIAADTDGKVIIGQTLTEMDHDAIAKSVAALIKDSNNLGKNVGKVGLKSITIELDEGYAVLAASDDIVLIALAGEDGAASIGLLKRNLISISKL